MVQDVADQGRGKAKNIHDTPAPAEGDREILKDRPNTRGQGPEGEPPTSVVVHVQPSRRAQKEQKDLGEQSLPRAHSKGSQVINVRRAAGPSGFGQGLNNGVVGHIPSKGRRSATHADGAGKRPHGPRPPTQTSLHRAAGSEGEHRPPDP